MKYEEEEESHGSVYCFSFLIDTNPIRFMLLVHYSMSFCICLWFLWRVRHAVYDKRLVQSRHRRWSDDHVTHVRMELNSNNDW